ncbi:MAG TPA: PilZ domain-containing protein [Polyangia bacterium]|nr:PilZ domain-containing protein [Polyangia bacterium]
MTQTRRDSPRIPYDEAVCLARIDGEGRLYGRALDLSASGISLVSTESCPIGTEIKCDILLPHGPRSVTGKIVRVTAAPGGFELAVGFGEIKPAVAAVIANLIADRTGSAEQGGMAPAETVRGSAADPSTTDAVPALVADVALDDQKRASTKRYGTPRPGDREKDQQALREGARPPTPGAGQAPRLPPTSLPPPCGQPLPSVVVAASLAPEGPPVEAPPPRRRMQGTAYIARRPDAPSWAMRPAAAMSTVSPAAAIPTQRLTTLQMAGSWSRALWVALPVVALVVAIVTLHLSH